MTNAWVMKATIRMGPWHVGHAKGSTSKSCCRRAAPAGVGVCRRRAPPAPRLACALRDRSAPSILPTPAQTVTVPLRDGPFRRNVRGSPGSRCVLQIVGMADRVLRLKDGKMLVVHRALCQVAIACYRNAHGPNRLAGTTAMPSFRLYAVVPVVITTRSSTSPGSVSRSQSR